jgi:hypothetical protein
VNRYVRGGESVDHEKGLVAWQFRTRRVHVPISTDSFASMINNALRNSKPASFCSSTMITSSEVLRRPLSEGASAYLTLSDRAAGPIVYQSRRMLCDWTSHENQDHRQHHHPSVDHTHAIICAQIPYLRSLQVLCMSPVKCGGADCWQKYIKHRDPLP